MVGGILTREIILATEMTVHNYMLSKCNTGRHHFLFQPELNLTAFTIDISQKKFLSWVTIYHCRCLQVQILKQINKISTFGLFKHLHDFTFFSRMYASYNDILLIMFSCMLWVTAYSFIENLPRCSAVSDMQMINYNSKKINDSLSWMEIKCHYDAVKKLSKSVNYLILLEFD